MVKNLLTFAAIFIGTLIIIDLLHLGVPLNINSVSTARSSEFTVTGTGKVDIVPDTANISAGISVSNVRTSQEAEAKLSETNNKIIDTLSRLGIKKEDIKTSNFSVNPDYSYNREIAPVIPGKETITGYNGNATLTIKVRNTKIAPQVIQETTAAGANNVYLSGFTVDSQEKYKEQARDEAIKNAKEQAQKLAKSLGIRLGRVVNFVESSPYNPYPYYGTESTGMKMADQQSAPPQIEPGSQTVTSTVTLFYQTK